jgi:hypothetical protein
MENMEANGPSKELADHRGIFLWWLRLTAPPGAIMYDQAPTRKERERLRHAGLTSYVAPFVFVAPLLLLQQANGDFATTTAIIVLMLFSLLALIFNRYGLQVVAALLLILSMDAVIEGSLITAQGGLSSGWLLTFDLFVIPLITAGVLLSRNYLWLFVILHIACILGDFYLLPHAADLDALVMVWHGPAVVFARPIIIQLGVFLLSFLQITSTNRAIIRADRAEEVAALQSAIARRKQQLEAGIQEIMNVLVHAANGHFTTQASLPKENVLWQIASSLNTLFARLQHSRQAEMKMYQTEQEVRKVIDALREAKRGHFVIWPHTTGSALDPLLQEIRTINFDTASKTFEASPQRVKPSDHSSR